jgi:hypothetical protein
MNSTTKAVLKELRDVATQLPRLEYTVKETIMMPGAELKLAGVAYDDDIDDNKVYEFDSPAYYGWNHYRRMKRIYLSNLKNGHDRAYDLVKDYITGVILAANKQEVQNA